MSLTLHAHPLSSFCWKVLIGLYENDIAFENVQAGDQRVYLSTDGAVPPKPGDTLTIGSDVFRVLRAGNLSPAGVDLLYDVQVRR